jgi:hypothetical protein
MQCMYDKLRLAFLVKQEYYTQYLSLQSPPLLLLLLLLLLWVLISWPLFNRC